jgi:hypothetical protein
MTTKKHNKRFAAFSCVLSLVAVQLSSAIAAPSSQLVTCIDLQSEKERISKNGTCRITHEAQAKWHAVQSDSPITTGSTSKSLTVCSNKEISPVSYQIIRNKCARHQVSSLYSRSTALASKPVVAQAVSYGHDTSQIFLAQDPATNSDAPIAYFTITSSKGNTQRIYSWRNLSLEINGLQAQTTYTFTVTATTADGTSPVSAASIPVTTLAYVPPAPASTTSPAAPVLAAPAFTLSALTETRTVNTPALGFTVASSSGGTIASYSISATPPGMTFNTSTGALTGTPTTIAGATSYTVTATNASGTATTTFTLTVTALVYTVGMTGPGGGLIFYVSPTSFTSTGSSCNTECRYLEAAPTTGPSSWTDVQYNWSSDDSNSRTAGSLATSIGSGMANTIAMLTTTGGYNGDTSQASYVSTQYRGPNSKSDWFLPSKDELNQLCKWQRGQAWVSNATICNSSGSINNSTNGAGSAGFVSGNYWSSSEAHPYDNYDGWNQEFHSGGQCIYSKYFGLYVRPIRAF